MRTSKPMIGVVVMASLAVTGFTLAYRADVLRAMYKSQVEAIRISFEDIGEDADTFEDIMMAIDNVDRKRDEAVEALGVATSDLQVERQTSETIRIDLLRQERELQEFKRKYAALEAQKEDLIRKMRQAPSASDRAMVQAEFVKCAEKLDQMKAEDFYDLLTSKEK